MRWFLPKDDTFLVLFDQASANVVRGVETFRGLLDDLRDLPEKVQAVREAEHEGDRIAHLTFAKLHKSFITPFDGEDIHALISRLDDILDAVNGAAQRLVLYRIEEIPGHVVEITELLLSSVKEVQKAVLGLSDRRRHRDAMAACVEINRYENLADTVHRTALAELFAGGTDAITVLKLKDLYALIEEATDRCEDVANVIEGIIIKSS